MLFRSLRVIVALLRSSDPREGAPLLSSLPAEADAFLTDEGIRLLRNAMPCFVRKAGGRLIVRPSERAPAPWEKKHPRIIRRQVFGRFLSALLADIEAGQTDRAAVMRIARLRPSTRRRCLHVLRFSRQAIERLRSVPLLLLDATLHPAI